VVGALAGDAGLLAAASAWASPASTGLANAPGAVVQSPGLLAGQAMVQASIDVALDDPGFGRAMGAQLTVLATSGVQQAQLQLNPADMGPITVQIALDGQAARVSFQAEVAATRTALESSLPALASALQEAGLTLTGGGVFQQAPQGGQSDGQQPRAANDRRADTAAKQAESGLPGQPRRVATPRGLVDLVA
jgi:flagellar hook-length control protein FliK